MIHTDTFDYHVDAKYYNFMWNEAMYLTVTYAANIENNIVKEVSITSVLGSPVLIGSIVLHGHWFDCDVAMIEAARANAERHVQGGHVHPIVLNSIRHFIRP